MIDIDKEWIMSWLAELRVRGRLALVAVACDIVQVDAAIGAAAEVVHARNRGCACAQHGDGEGGDGHEGPMVYSRGAQRVNLAVNPSFERRATDAGAELFEVRGAGQWANESRRDRTRYGAPDASPETIRLGVARGERPLLGVRTPVPVALVPNDTTADERDAWHMPDGVIGSLLMNATCPACSLSMVHPVVGANGKVVMIHCDNYDCQFVWTVRSIAELRNPRPVG